MYAKIQSSSRCASESFAASSRTRGRSSIANVIVNDGAITVGSRS
jgi:hypothetical protein